MKNLFSILLFALLLGATACYDNVDNSLDISINPSDPAVLVNTTITGSLFTADHEMQTGYSLEVGEETHEVDTKIFFTQVDNVNKKGQSIYAKRGDQVISIAHTQLIENDINLIELQEFNPMNSKAINSSGPDLVNIRPNISLQITVGNLRDAQGEVIAEDVYVDHRDLSNLNHISQLGITAFSARQDLLATSHLQAFYMQPRLENGTELTVDRTASIQLEINVDQEASLFHLDETQDRWIEIKSLQEGNNNIKVKETGYFTISTYQIAIYAEGKISRNNDKVAYQKLEWPTNANHTSYTSADGRWFSVIPRDLDVNLELLNPCNEIVSNHMIPASDIDVTAIEIEAEGAKYYNLTTQVIDCDGDLEMNSGIKINNNNNSSKVYAFEGSSVDKWISVCDFNFDLAAYDIDTDQQGPIIPWDLNIVDGRNYLVNCNALAEGYSYIKIKGDKRVFSAFNTIKDNGETILKSQDDKVRFRFAGDNVGSYTQEDVNVYIRDEGFGSQGYFVACENSDSCGFNTWNVTHYEAGSERWVRVSFAGEIWMQTIDPPEAGYFPVEGVILCKAN